MNIKKAILLRVRLAFLFVLLFALGIVGKIVDLQYVQGEKWRKLAESVGFQYRTVRATRGNIYSSDGSLLATSLPFYKVAFDPTLVKNETYKKGLDSLSMMLSSHFRDKTDREYRRKINDSRLEHKRYVYLNKTLINYQEKKKMEKWPIFREGRLKGGVIFEKVNMRFYPFKNMGVRTVGYVNEDRQGAGIEYSFNDVLGGKHGEALFQKLAGGSWKPAYDGSEVTPEDGYDIESTIDVNLQDVAEDALLGALERHRANYGCLVLMEVETGEIKAMANLGRNPSGSYSENYNYAVGDHGLTDPGSTFKLASMIALFEEKNIELTDSVETGNGQYVLYDRKINDHKPGGYGKITVKEVFEKSSNIGVMKLVNQHFSSNPQRFIDYINDFGLSKPMGFQMKGEAMPYVKNPKDKTWSGISLPWMSIGYELKISPLHILSFYNAVANDGEMIVPIIVKSVKRADNVIDNYEARVINSKICSDKTLKKVKSMLEGVVETGTAMNIRGTIYKIAGKTGTAKKLKAGHYTNEYYTSFVGYFPAHKPKYSCIVVIDEPQGYQIYGSDVAAPVFKEMADKVYATDIEMHKVLPEKRFEKLGVFPMVKSGYQADLKFLCKELGVSNHSKVSDEWVTSSTKNNAIYWQANDWKLDKVPNVKGMTLRDALYLLENKGLKVSFSGNGRVMDQSMPAGTRVIRGSRISIKLS